MNNYLIVYDAIVKRGRGKVDNINIHRNFIYFNEKKISTYTITELKQSILVNLNKEFSDGKIDYDDIVITNIIQLN